MSKEEWKLLTLEELEGVEECWLSIPDFSNNYTLRSDSVADVDTFLKKNEPEAEGQYTHSSRDLTKSLDEIEAYTKGWSEDDNTASLVSAINSIASEVEDAMSNADEVIGYRETHEEAVNNYEEYMREVEDSTIKDIEELQTAIQERDELIDNLKWQLKYCLEVKDNSLELKQSTERILNLEE